MQFTFNSIYSYFLFLYHVLLKSIFYFNVFDSGIDFCFQSMNEMPNRNGLVKIINANTAEMVL